MGSGILSFIDFNPPAPSQFPVILIDHFKVLKPFSDLAHITTSEPSGSDQTIRMDAFSGGGSTYDRELKIFTDLGRLIFQISNKLSKGDSHDDKIILSKLGNTLKYVALTSSSWKGLLTAGGGPTSMSLIEQLFRFSITNRDVTLATMMLQIGADPNQEVLDESLGEYISALDFAMKSCSGSITELLLNAGAGFGQRSLKSAIISKSFDTADRLLRSDPYLDLNFDYLDDLEEYRISQLQALNFETVTLMGLVCLEYMGSSCFCDGNDSAAKEHSSQCRMNASLTILRYLLNRRAAITLDTMILASFSANIINLRFLIQHGGNVCGVNKFGFSCLDGASLMMDLQYDLFNLLLRSGATVNIPQNHNTFGSQASPLHRLVVRQESEYLGMYDSLPRIIDLLFESGADINYRIQHLGSPSQLAEAYQKALWSQPSGHMTPMDLVAQAKAESPVEYAIIAGNEDIARLLIGWGCQLTGRETKLSVKFGLLHLLKEFRKHGLWDSCMESSGRTYLRLALRWGHNNIVQSLLRDGVKFGEHDMVDALQYPGISILSPKVQIDLICATPDLDQRRIFGLPFLEICCLKFSGLAVRGILERYPAVYDSGALLATLLRALNYGGFQTEDIKAMSSRRNESNCDWDKENTALLIAAMFKRLDILRILVTSDTACERKTARLTKDVFSRILDHRYENNPFRQIDPTDMLGYQDWVACSPLVGVVTTPEDPWVDASVSEDMLDHMLACSYEPDALTVVVAATSAKWKKHILRRFQHLENWRSIVSIDNHDRPPWCPTALQVAASEGNEELVGLLLDSGVSVNEKTAKQPLGLHMPRTALQAAIDNGNLRLIDLCIERGSNINAPAAEDSGATALQVACIHGNLDLSLRLLELGADANAKAALRRGRTALEGAAEHGRIDTIQLLLNYGVGTDGSHRKQYIKAIVHAERNLHLAAAALLKEHRAWTDEDEECYKSLQSYEWCDL